MGRGFFITLEGVEGSGKTTQAATLADALRAEGRAVSVRMSRAERAPARRFAKFSSIPRSRSTSHRVAAGAGRSRAARSRKIAPGVEAGEIVISDRYSDSTVAYQGYGRGFDLRCFGKLNHLATAGMVPDLTIVLDCPAEIGLARTRERVKGKKHRSDRFESEMVDFHRRVREGFLAIAKAEPQRVKIVDSQQAI